MISCVVVFVYTVVDVAVVVIENVDVDVAIWHLGFSRKRPNRNSEVKSESSFDWRSWNERKYTFKILT